MSDSDMAAGYAGPSTRYSQPFSSVSMRPSMDWKRTTIEWRKLSAQERRQRHLRAIPRGVTTSMAMERQPVSEQFVRERL